MLPPPADAVAWITSSDESISAPRRTSSADRAAHVPMAVALRQFRHASFDEIKAEGDDAICALFIIEKGSRNCDPFRDSLVDCVARHGVAKWERLLGDRCIKSSFWLETLPKLMSKHGGNGNNKNNNRKSSAAMDRGVILSSQLVLRAEAAQKPRWIPPDERTVAPFPPPRMCKRNCKHFPIGFALPRSMFVDAVPRAKAFDWMPLMPLPSPSSNRYAVDIFEEDLQRALYSSSWFSWAMKRAGWDSVRQYEIVASGSVPVFIDIAAAPRRSLGHWPRDLLLRALQLPGIAHVAKNSREYTRPHMFGGVNVIKNPRIDVDLFNVSEYYSLADELLAYGKRHLTTSAVAAYLLRALNAQDAKRVLYFGRGPYDYLDATLMHGLADLGIEIVMVAPSKDYLFQEVIMDENASATRAARDQRLRGLRIHGGGYGFGLRAKRGAFDPPSFMDHRAFQQQQSSLRQQVEAGKFDVLIHSLTGEQQYYFVDEARKARIPVAFLQFRDGHGDPDVHSRRACNILSQHDGRGGVFIREIEDREC